MVLEGAPNSLDFHVPGANRQVYEVVWNIYDRLLGFGVKRGSAGQPERWLRSQKVFKSVEPNPKSDDPSKPKRFYTSDHPIQSFLWGDYATQPDTEYTFTVVPMYGKPGSSGPAALTFGPA